MVLDEYMDLIDAWHTSGPEEVRPLHEYLGLTWEEYCQMLEIKYSSHVKPIRLIRDEL